MPFAFLAPLFLAGLAALAIPVLIHLANRPKKEVVRFPSLMFLERVEYQATSRRNIRHPLLFLLRVLALILVVAAFARPYLDRPDAPPVPIDGDREVVVLLDRSASMAAGDRMERARAAVAEVADGLRRGDRATVVAFDLQAAALNRATDQPAVLRAAADSVSAGHAATRYAPALRLAESILSGSPLPRLELVVVSDFQRTGWSDEGAPTMPAGTAIRTVPVAPVAAASGTVAGGAAGSRDAAVWTEEVGNAAVTDVRMARERFSGRDRARVAARVVNHAAGAVDAPVSLVVDGRTVQTLRARVDGGAAALVEFDALTLPDRAARAEVRLSPGSDDALAGDDAHHFVLSPGRSVRVLVVEPVGDERAGLYFRRALEAGGDHEVAVVREDRFEASRLAGVDVVVLNGAALRPEMADPVRELVSAGGGLVAVLGERSRATWNDEGAGLLPGTLGGTRDAGAGVALGAVRTEHPLLAPFRASTAGLTGARFYRYRELEPGGDAAVLARYTDGRPALAVAGVGAGRTVALTAPLDGRWSDLVLQPAFVPLAHRLVEWASAREPVPAWRTVGDLVEVPPGRGEDAVLVAPSGSRLALSDTALHRLAERGFYEVRDPGATAPLPPLAVNGDPRESDLRPFGPGELVAAVAPRGAAPVRASFAPEDRERRQSLWWWFLAGAFLLMVAETMVSNVLSRRPLPVVEGARET